MVADTDEDSYDDYDFTVYTGVKNVPDIDGRTETKVVVAAEKDSNVAKVVYIEDADTGRYRRGHLRRGQPQRQAREGHRDRQLV